MADIHVLAGSVRECNIHGDLDTARAGATGFQRFVVHWKGPRDARKEERMSAAEALLASNKAVVRQYAGDKFFPARDGKVVPSHARGLDGWEQARLMGSKAVTASDLQGALQKHRDQLHTLETYGVAHPDLKLMKGATAMDQWVDSKRRTTPQLQRLVSLLAGEMRKRKGEFADVLTDLKPLMKGDELVEESRQFLLKHPQLHQLPAFEEPNPKLAEKPEGVEATVKWVRHPARTLFDLQQLLMLLRAQAGKRYYTAGSEERGRWTRLYKSIGKLTVPPPADKGSAAQRREAKLRPMARAMAAVGNAYGAAAQETGDEMRDAVIDDVEERDDRHSLRWVNEGLVKELEAWLRKATDEPELQRTGFVDFWFWGLPADAAPHLQQQIGAGVRRTKEGGTLLWRPAYDDLLHIKGFAAMGTRMLIRLGHWGVPARAKGKWSPYQLLQKSQKQLLTAVQSRQQGHAGALITAYLPWMAGEAWRDAVLGVGAEHRMPLDVLEGNVVKQLPSPAGELDLGLTEWGAAQAATYNTLVQMSRDLAREAVNTYMREKGEALKWSADATEKRRKSLLTYLFSHMMYEQQYRQKRRAKLGVKARVQAAAAAEAAAAAQSSDVEGNWHAGAATRSVWDWTVNALWAMTPVDSMAYTLARQGISIGTLGTARMADGSNKVDVARAAFAARIQESLNKWKELELSSSSAWVRPDAVQTGPEHVRAMRSVRWNYHKSWEYLVGKAWGTKNDAVLQAYNQLQAAGMRGAPTLNGRAPALSLMGMDGQGVDLSGGGMSDDSSGKVIFSEAIQTMWDDGSARQCVMRAAQKPPKTWGSMAAYMAPAMEMEGQARALYTAGRKTYNTYSKLCQSAKVARVWDTAASAVSKAVGLAAGSGAQASAVNVGSATAVAGAGAGLMAVGALAAGAFLVWRTHMVQSLESYTKDEVQLPARHWYRAARAEALQAAHPMRTPTSFRSTLTEAFDKPIGGEVAAGMLQTGVNLLRPDADEVVRGVHRVQDTSVAVVFRLGTVGEDFVHTMDRVRGSTAGELRKKIYAAMREHSESEGVQGLEHVLLGDARDASSWSLLTTMFDGWMEMERLSQWRAHVHSALVFSVGQDAAAATPWSDNGLRAVRKRMMREEVEDRVMVANYDAELEAYKSLNMIKKAWATPPELLTPSDFKSFRDFTQDGAHNNMALNVLSEAALQDWAPSYMPGTQGLMGAGRVSPEFLHYMAGSWVAPRVHSLTPEGGARMYWPVATSQRVAQYLAWQSTATRVTGTPSLRLLVQELAAHELVASSAGGAAAVHAWKQGEAFVRLRDMLGHLWVRRAPYIYDVLYVIRCLWTLMRLGLWQGRDWVSLGREAGVNWETGAYSMPPSVAGDVYAFRGMEAYIAVVRATRAISQVWPSVWDSSTRDSVFLDPTDPKHRDVFLRRAQHPFYTYASHAALEYCYLAVLQLDTPVARLGEIEDTREVTSCLLSAIVMTSVAFMRDESAALSPDTVEWMKRAQAWLSTAGATHNPALRSVWKFLGTGFLNMLHTQERAAAEEVLDSMVAKQWEELVWSEVMEEEGGEGEKPSAFKGTLGDGSEHVAVGGAGTAVEAAMRVLGDPRRWRKPADWNADKWRGLVEEVVAGKRTPQNAKLIDALEKQLLEQVAPASGRPSKATPDLLLTWRVRDTMSNVRAWEALEEQPHPGKNKRLKEMWARSMGLSLGRYHKPDADGKDRDARAGHMITMCDAIHVQNMKNAQSKGVQATLALGKRMRATLLMNVVAVLAAANPNTDGGVTRSVTRMLGRAASMVAMTAQATFVAHGVYKSVAETGFEQSAPGMAAKALWKSRGNPFTSESMYAISLLVARTSFTIMDWVRRNAAPVEKYWAMGRRILREQYVSRKDSMGKMASFLVGAADSLVSWVDGETGTRVTAVGGSSSGSGSDAEDDTQAFPELDELDASLRETFRVAMTLSEKMEAGAAEPVSQDEAVATDLGAFHAEGEGVELGTAALGEGVRALSNVFDDRVAAGQRSSFNAEAVGHGEWRMEEASHALVLEASHMLCRKVVVPRISEQYGVHMRQTLWLDVLPGFVNTASVTQACPSGTAQSVYTQKYLEYFLKTPEYEEPATPLHSSLWCMAGVLPLTWPRQEGVLLTGASEWCVVLHCLDGAATGRFGAFITTHAPAADEFPKEADPMFWLMKLMQPFDPAAPDLPDAAATRAHVSAVWAEAAPLMSPHGLLRAILPLYMDMAGAAAVTQYQGSHLYRSYMLQVLEALAGRHGGVVHRVERDAHVLSVPAENTLTGDRKTAAGLPIQTQLAELLPPPHRFGVESSAGVMQQHAAAAEHATQWCRSRSGVGQWLKEFGGLDGVAEAPSAPRAASPAAHRAWLDGLRFVVLDSTVCEAVLRHAVNPFTEPGLHEVNMNRSGESVPSGSIPEARAALDKKIDTLQAWLDSYE